MGHPLCLSLLTECLEVCPQLTSTTLSPHLPHGQEEVEGSKGSIRDYPVHGWADLAPPPASHQGGGPASEGEGGEGGQVRQGGDGHGLHGQVEEDMDPVVTQLGGGQGGGGGVQPGGRLHHQTGHRGHLGREGLQITWPYGKQDYWHY